MRVVIQRVSEAAVRIEGVVKAEIGEGLLVLVGVEDADDESDADWLAQKITKLRIFDDEAGVMNRSVMDVDGEVLVVSQFTLHALTAKGNRPSYIRAARPERAIPMYEYFCLAIEKLTGKRIGTGRFGADMRVSLVNEGPVTIVMDSKARE